MDDKFGIEVSKKSRNVDSNDEKDIALSSRFSNFKIVQSGTTRLVRVANDSNEFVNVTLEKGYNPNYIVIATASRDIGDQGGDFPDSERWSLPITAISLSSGIVHYHIFAYLQDLPSGQLHFFMYAPSAGSVYAGNSRWLIHWHVVEPVINR